MKSFISILILLALQSCSGHVTSGAGLIVVKEVADDMVFITEKTPISGDACLTASRKNENYTIQSAIKNALSKRSEKYYGLANLSIRHYESRFIYSTQKCFYVTGYPLKLANE